MVDGSGIFLFSGEIGDELGQSWPADGRPLCYCPVLLEDVLFFLTNSFARSLNVFMGF
jgi:hypothetical protein